MSHPWNVSNPGFRPGEAPSAAMSSQSTCPPTTTKPVREGYHLSNPVRLDKAGKGMGSM